MTGPEKRDHFGRFFKIELLITGECSRPEAIKCHIHLVLRVRHHGATAISVQSIIHTRHYKLEFDKTSIEISLLV